MKVLIDVNILYIEERRNQNEVFYWISKREAGQVHLANEKLRDIKTNNFDHFMTFVKKKTR